VIPEQQLSLAEVHPQAEHGQALSFRTEPSTKLQQDRVSTVLFILIPTATDARHPHKPLSQLLIVIVPHLQLLQKM
jgi:hypothetical protein